MLRNASQNGLIPGRRADTDIYGDRFLATSRTMTTQSRSSETWNASRPLVLAQCLWFMVGATLGAPVDPQLYYNQDCTQFFMSDIPDGKAGETIDRYVDEIADAGVTVFFCNTNARRTNYRSSAWEAFWDGYDPSGPDDQLFLAPVPPEQAPAFRKWMGNMLKVHQEGVDYPDRVVARCRQRHMSPWISLRMNDCHYNDVPNHPFHGSFWVKNPQLRRQNCTGYFASCLDFSERAVRDYYMALIEETLDRYNVDGLELDFMREPYLFSADKEKEGRAILTAWLREIHQRTKEAALQRGHPIGLGVRVPSRPETALGMGLDAVTWAKEGLIDLLVVTPRWATLEFGMAIPEWRQQLALAKSQSENQKTPSPCLLPPSGGEGTSIGSKVTLVGGLEVLYRPSPGAVAEYVSPELAHGAASLVLADGADAVYLFNYFPNTMSKPVYRDTLRAMISLDALRDVPRTIGVTYRDIIAPGESYQPPLPAQGTAANFTMKCGPEPPEHWRREVVVGIAAAAGAPPSTPFVFVDGVSCDVVEQDDAKAGLYLKTFRIPDHVRALRQTHEVKIASRDQTPLVIQRVELRMRP